MLNLLREDLARAGVRARIHANFRAGRTQRQVDLLIVTDSRLVQAELKCLNAHRPIVGGVNGPWHQVLEDGSERPLDNYYNQALQATYSVGDEMKRCRTVPAHPTGKPVKDIDSILLIHPAVPTGSTLERHQHIDVVGYGDLVARLTRPGPRPAWTIEHWDAFARHMQVYAETVETPAERERRLALDTVADFRMRFISRAKGDLPDFVPIHTRVGANDLVADPRRPIAEALRRGDTGVVTGTSGAGKSHLAVHVAVDLATSGWLPLVVPCRDCQVGRFPVALKRAAAPFTTEPIVEFIDRSAQAGAPTLIVLDGLNDCSERAQADLLEQLDVFRLRHPVSVLMTSAGGVRSLDADVLHVSLLEPNRDERAAILRSYGAEPAEDLLAFENVFDLSIAAEIHRDLPPGSPKSDLFDLFITQRAGEQQRRLLRVLATQMNESFKVSMTVTEALQHVRAAEGTSASAVDGLLASQLLSVASNRVRFRHDRLYRYLAAEALVTGSQDAADAADQLRDPRNADLAWFAVACEPRPTRRHEMLRELADPNLLHAAVSGEFRRTVADLVAADARHALSSAEFDTATGTLRPPTDDLDSSMVQWEGMFARSAIDAGLLNVAGRSLYAGRFVDEICALVDATDDFMSHEVQRLRGEGHRGPISVAFEALYAHGWSTKGESQAPAAAIVLSQMAMFGAAPLDPFPEALVDRLWSEGLDPDQWGRHLAMLRVLPLAEVAAMSIAPDVVQSAWSAGGYHLRLDALDLARRLAHRLDEATRQRMVEVMSAIDPRGNVWLESMVVEVLAAYGESTPSVDGAHIRGLIESVLAGPDNPDSWVIAQGIFNSRYEPQEIVGPYYETFEALPPGQRVELAVVACSGGALPISFPEQVVGIIPDAASPNSDERLKAALAHHATHLEISSLGSQDAVAAHLEALRGLAKVVDRLPELGDHEHSVGPEWRFIDEALFAIHRGDETWNTVPSVRTLWRSHFGGLMSVLKWIDISRFAAVGVVTGSIHCGYFASVAPR